ncbi:hypothetical protein KB559_13480 [Paenibacillus sp. Marseille-P2973]|uniref:hypothetical protein n=1 Tax=Paenibacillus sp. Marseille-P2973 TaxID=1871032 RepID=UPI001B374A48|nr:hypothetical protein [Paenibacillus sp. Marseille-P2973]MBQ4899856.1 hypothetical protein [Paenibacillus sp. Marseille-P2973]
MLLEQFKQTRDIIERTKELQKQDDRVKRYTGFANNVQKQSKDLTQTMKSISAIYQAFSYFTVPAPILQKILDLIEETRASITTEAPSVQKIQATMGAVDELKNVVQQRWTELSNKNHRDAIKMLNMLSGVLKQDTNIGDLIMDISDFEKEWPMTPAKMVHYQNKVEEATRKIASLGVSITVQQFLEKLGRGQATLMDLNAEVMKWIEQQHLSNNISITLK